MDELEAFKDTLLIARAIKFIGVMLACYCAIGFANRISIKRWHYSIFALFIAIPIVLLATFPELDSFSRYRVHTSLLIYYS